MCIQVRSSGDFERCFESSQAEPDSLWPLQDGAVAGAGAGDVEDEETKEDDEDEEGEDNDGDEGDEDDNEADEDEENVEEEEGDAGGTMRSRRVMGSMMKRRRDTHRRARMTKARMRRREDEGG